LWRSEAIVEAVGGAPSGGAFAAHGVSIDTRTLEPGDLFVVLEGERDAHAFVPQALANGAAGSLVTKPVDGPHILVPDALKALEKLGIASRIRAPAAKRGAVTGSVGKTGVTQAIRAGLMAAGRAHSSVESYNNHIGVPLTLARMPADTERGVFEIGMNHADEIRPLVQMVRPHAAVITTVGAVHVENFPDGAAGVARAKAEIFEGLEPGGVAILNADNTWYELLHAEALRMGAQVRSFGTGAACDARLLDITPGHETRIVAEIEGRTLDFPILQTGLHWGLNSLAVLLMLEALDVDRETAVSALGSYAPLGGRGAESTVHGPRGAFVLVDDSYNANPISMEAALTTLGARKVFGRRIVALTDMLELGADAAQLHADLAAPIEAASVDLVFCSGLLMKSLWDALPPTRQGGYAETAALLEPQLVRAVEPGDVVMVKGSKGSKAHALAAALAALDSPSGGAA
jgi:UDP-N-acetylmuramoyl-tripeptide--D-alanyl-D-alanine ligase